jgi:glucose-1-phosphate adenylyltransferase
VRSDRGTVLALVLAGGEGGRLDVLTTERAKPAMPFAGVYRLIDFPLSNCHHSRIDDVWILQQYEPHSLATHLAGGRPWDLDRTYGGLRVHHPYLGDSESGWYEGNADAIYRNRQEIAREDPDVLLVLSADHVYRLDYSEVIAGHRKAGAAVTVVTTRVPHEEAGEYGVVEIDADRITGFEYKPDEPKGDVVTTEVFAYDTRRLLETLDEIVAEEGEDSLADFGDALLPRLVERGDARAHPLEDYWKDVGRPSRYWQAHMDLLEPEPPLDLDDPAWPILTRGVQRPPARIEQGARVETSLVSPGAILRGRVERSVLGPGVVVEEDAEVSGSIIFHDTHVERGARIEHAIVDARACIRERATVGGGAPDDDGLALVGHGVEVTEDNEAGPGARLEPETGHDEAHARRPG